MARKKIIAGNWKMNMTPSEAVELVNTLKPLVANDDVDVVFCVPAIDIIPVVEAAKGSNIQIGAENMYFEEKGAFTGEISPAMLTDAGVKYVVLGHSERREYFAETSETVNKKMLKAFEHGITPIMCCGETLELLGGDEKTPRLSLPSPFAKQQIKVIINNAISTKYRNRSHSLIAIVEMIHACVLAKAGNYIVFCPSYAYLQQIAEEFANQYPDIAISIQDGNMNDEQKQAYLKQFEEMDGLHVAFCVLGGMFAEGIDLKGDRLIGAIIIGVGLPKLHPQLDLIKAHFDEINQMGYAYAYQFPGMNKVLQAAGRVIRSLSDKGMVAFIDERFTTRFYRNLLPIQYAHYEIINEPQRVYTVLSSFWQE